MKKELLILGVILLVLPFVGANENYTYASSIDASVKLISSIDIVPESTDYNLQSLDVNITFIPRNDDFQTVDSTNFISIPKASVTNNEAYVYSWSNVKDESILYGFEARVSSVQKLPHVTQSVSFPIRGDVDRKYLTQTETILSNSPSIRQKATEIVAGETDTLRAAHKIGVWVQENIEYDLSTLTAESTQDAQWVFDNKQGVCDELTTLYVAMLRSVGIPAKFVSGMVYTAAIDGGFGAHAWAEVFIPDVGWVPFDPTFGQLGFVDATHIKMDEPRDFRDPSVGFLWRIQNAKVVPQAIDDIEVDVLDFQSTTIPQVSMEIKPLIDDVGASSFVPIEVQIVNLQDYYVPVQVFLTKVPAHIGASQKQVLLDPRGAQTVYFIVKTPEVLREGYTYFSEVEVQDFFGTKSNTTVHYAPGNPQISEGEARSKFANKETGDYSEVVDATFFCSGDKSIYYTYENNIDITCNVKSLSNKNIQNIRLCVEEECTRFDLGIAESKEFKFTQVAEVKEYNSILDIDIEHFESPVSIEVRDTPELEIEFRSPPDDLSYHETREIVVSLKASEPLGDMKIDLKGIEIKDNLYQLGATEGELVLFVSGKDISKSQSIDLMISFKDRNGKDYSVQESLEIEVTDIPFFTKVWNFLFGWI